MVQPQPPPGTNAHNGSGSGSGSGSGIAATPSMPTGRTPETHGASDSATAAARNSSSAIVPATPALLTTASSGRFTTPACESPHRADEQVHTDCDFAQLHSSPAPKLPEETFSSRRSAATTAAAAATTGGGEGDHRRTRPNVIDHTALNDNLNDPEDDPDLKTIQDMALPSIDPKDAVPTLLEWLEATDDPLAWVFAYRSLLMRIREAQSADEHQQQSTVAGSSGADENAPREPTQEQELSVLAPRMGDLVKAFKRDITQASDDLLIHEALKLLGFVFYTPRLFNVIGPQVTGDLIQRALAVAKSTEDKTTCHLCIWVLRMQRLPATHYTSRTVLADIIDTLAYALRVPAPFQSTVIPTEAIFALDSLLRLLPRPVMSLAKEWVLPACMNLAATNDLVRKHCIEFFQGHLLTFAEESSKLQPALDHAWEKYSVRMIFDLTELTNKHERDGMKAWSISMVLFAVQMQKHQQFINGMLKIVERYFNMKRASAKLYGYRAWTYLVYASAVTRTLAQERRVKLLMIPIVNSFNHDRFSQLQLCAADAWMNLLYAMSCTGAAWPGLALEAAIKPALPRLLVTRDPEVRNLGWAVFDVLVNVAEFDPIVNAHAEINLTQLLPLINPDVKPTDYLRSISVGPKWFRSHVGDLLAFVRAGHFMGPKLVPLDQMVLSPGMQQPALPVRTHEAFRRVILGLARACSKDIHLSQDSVSALLKVGEFLADMIHPPAAIVDEAADIEAMLNKAAAEAEAAQPTRVAANPAPAAGQQVTLRPTCPDPCWRMDMLDLILATMSTHMPARLLQSKRCRYADLEETCRQRIRDASTLADQLFTYADVHLTPAVYLVLLWVESWTSDDLVAAENARAESEMQEQHMVKRLSSAVGGSEADPMPASSTSRLASAAAKNKAKMPSVADDPARVVVYWEKYAELVTLAADAQSLVHSLYSILYLLEVQTSTYQLKAQLSYWIPIAELLTTHLRTQRARATPGRAPNSLSDDHALDAGQQHDDLIPSILMWPVCKVVEWASVHPVPSTLDPTLDFPLAEWTALWDLVATQDTSAPRLIKNPFYLHHLFARTMMQTLEVRPQPAECLLVAMTAVTRAVLDRYAATLKSSRMVMAQDSVLEWVSTLLGQVRQFLQALLHTDEVQGPLSAAIPTLVSAVANVFDAAMHSRAPFAVTNVLALLEAWTRPVYDICMFSDRIDKVLTSDGLREFHQVMGNALKSLLSVWLDPRLDLPLARFMELAGPVLACGMTANAGDEVKEIAYRVWNAKISDNNAGDPELLAAMPSHLVDVLQGFAEAALVSPVVLPLAFRKQVDQADQVDITVIAPGAAAVEEDVTDEDEQAATAAAQVKARRAAAMARATHSKSTTPGTPTTPNGTRNKSTRTRDEADGLDEDMASMDDDDNDDDDARANSSPLHKKRRVVTNSKGGTPRRASRVHRPSAFGADSQTDYVVIPPSPVAPAAGTPLGKRRMDSNGERLLTERQLEREEERAFIPPMFNALDQTQASAHSSSHQQQGASTRAGLANGDGDHEPMDVDENDNDNEFSRPGKPPSQPPSRPRFQQQDTLWTFNPSTGQPALNASQANKLSFHELVNLQGQLLQWTSVVQTSMSRAVAQRSMAGSSSASALHQSNNQDQDQRQ